MRGIGLSAFVLVAVVAISPIAIVVGKLMDKIFKPEHTLERIAVTIVGVYVACFLVYLFSRVGTVSEKLFLASDKVDDAREAPQLLRFNRFGTERLFSDLRPWAFRRRHRELKADIKKTARKKCDF